MVRKSCRSIGVFYMGGSQLPRIRNTVGGITEVSGSLQQSKGRNFSKHVHIIVPWNEAVDNEEKCRNEGIGCKVKINI